MNKLVKIKEVTNGEFYTDGMNLYVSGHNKYGCLGAGQIEKCAKVKIPRIDARDIKQIVEYNDTSTLIVMANGDTYMTGTETCTNTFNKYKFKYVSQITKDMKFILSNNNIYIRDNKLNKYMRFGEFDMLFDIYKIESLKNKLYVLSTSGVLVEVDEHNPKFIKYISPNCYDMCANDNTLFTLADNAICILLPDKRLGKYYINDCINTDTNIYVDKNNIILFNDNAIYIEKLHAHKNKKCTIRISNIPKIYVISDNKYTTIYGEKDGVFINCYCTEENEENSKPEIQKFKGNILTDKPGSNKSKNNFDEYNFDEYNTLNVVYKHRKKYEHIHLVHQDMDTEKDFAFLYNTKTNELNRIFINIHNNYKIIGYDENGIFIQYKNRKVLYIDIHGTTKCIYTADYPILDSVIVDGEYLAVLHAYSTFIGISLNDSMPNTFTYAEEYNKSIISSNNYDISAIKK